MVLKNLRRRCSIKWLWFWWWLRLYSEEYFVRIRSTFYANDVFIFFFLGPNSVEWSLFGERSRVETRGELSWYGDPYLCLMKNYFWIFFATNPRKCSFIWENTSSIFLAPLPKFQNWKKIQKKQKFEQFNFFFEKSSTLLNTWNTGKESFCFKFEKNRSKTL